MHTFNSSSLMIKRGILSGGLGALVIAPLSFASVRTSLYCMNPGLADTRCRSTTCMAVSPPHWCVVSLM